MTQALNIKLVVNVVDGRLRLLGAARSFTSGLRRVLNQVERMGPLEHLAVVHTRRRETAEEMADRLAARTHFPSAHLAARDRVGAGHSRRPGRHRRPGRASDGLAPGR